MPQPFFAADGPSRGSRGLLVRSGNSAAKCAQELIGGTTGISETVAACAGVRRNALVGCFLDKRPELAATGRLYGCFADGGEGSSLVANCTGDLIQDEEIRRTLACVTAANNDPTRLPFARRVRFCRETRPVWPDAPRPRKARLFLSRFAQLRRKRTTIGEFPRNVRSHRQAIQSLCGLYGNAHCHRRTWQVL